MSETLVRLLHPKEVADLLQVSERTVRRIATDPVEGPRYGAVKVRGQWRFVNERVAAMCRGMTGAKG